MLYPFATIDYEKRVLNLYKTQPNCDFFLKDVEIDSSLSIECNRVVQWREWIHRNVSINPWNGSYIPANEKSLSLWTEDSFMDVTVTSGIWWKKSNTFKVFKWNRYAYLKKPVVIHEKIQLANDFVIRYIGFDVGEV